MRDLPDGAGIAAVHRGGERVQLHGHVGDEELHDFHKQIIASRAERAKLSQDGLIEAARRIRRHNVHIMRALIADDDPIASAVLSRALRSWNIEPIAARDGVSAWNAMSGEHAPSLAIVDWITPGLDGIALCRRIRDHPSRAHMYVILLTS